jgi:hypothetical protein
VQSVLKHRRERSHKRLRETAAKTQNAMEIHLFFLFNSKQKKSDREEEKFRISEENYQS